MANGADGEVRISTKIDNSGINAGLAKTAKEIDRLTANFHKQGDSIKKQEASLAALKRQYDALVSAEKAPASLTAMESQLKRITKEIEAQTAEQKNLEAQSQAALAALKPFEAAQNAVKIATAYTRQEVMQLEEEYLRQKTILDNMISDEAFSIEEIRAFQTEVEGLSLEWRNASREVDNFEKAQQLLSSGGLEKAQAAITSLDRELLATEEPLINLQNKAAGLSAEIQRIKMDPSTSAEAQGLSDKILLATQNLDTSRAKANELKNTLLNTFAVDTAPAERAIRRLGSETKDAGNTARSSANGFERFSKKINSLVLTVGVFSVIRKALTSLRNSLGNLLAGNKAFAASLSTIKGNLLTAFAPIWQAIQPALLSFMNVLARVTGYVASFINMLFGTSVASSKKAAEAFNKQAQSIGGVGSAAEETQKQLSGLDELAQISQDTAADGGGGAGGTEIDFGGEEQDIGWLSGLNDLLAPLQEIDFTNLVNSFNKLLDAMKPITRTLFEGLEWAWYNLLVPFAKWTIEDAIPAFLNLLTGALKVLDPILSAFKTAGIWFWDYFLKPIAGWAGTALVDGLNGLANVMTNIGAFFKEHQSVLDAGAKILTSLGAGYIAVVGGIKAYEGISKLATSFAAGIKGIGAAILAHPGILVATLVAGAIIGIATAINEADTKARENELAKRFGDVTLSMEELKEICEDIKTPFGKAMDAILEQSKRAKEAADNVTALGGALTTSLSRVSITLDANVDQSSKDAAKDKIQGDIDAFIASVQSSLIEQKLSQTMAIEALFSQTPEQAQTIISDLNTYLEPIMAEAALVGQELRDKMVSALQDNKLDADEKKAILASIQRLSEINQQIADYESFVKIERIRVEYADDAGRLSKDAFEELLAAIQESTQSQMDSAKEVYIKALASIDMVYKDDPAMMASLKADAESAYKGQLLDIEWNVRSFEVSNFPEMLSGYASNIEKLVSTETIPQLGDFLEAATKKAWDEAVSVGMEGDYEYVSNQISTNMEQMYREALDGIALDTEKGVEIAEELLESMRPTYDSLKANADAFIAAGNEIPQSLIEGMTGFENLQKVIEASKTPITEAVGAARGTIADHAQELINTGGLISEKIAEGIPQKAADINAAASGVLGSALDQSGAAEGAEALGENTINKYTAAQIAQKEDAKTKADGVATEIAGEYDISEETKTEGGDAVKEFSTGMTDEQPTSDAAAKTVADSALKVQKDEIENSDTGAQANGNLQTELTAKGQLEKQDTTDTASKNVATAMISSAKSVINDETTGAKSIGEAFDAGIISGIESKSGDVYAAVKKLAEGMKKSLKTGLEVHSPSKFGIRTSGSLLDGIVLGIVDNTSRVISAVKDMADAMKDTMSDIVLPAPEVETTSVASLGASAYFATQSAPVAGQIEAAMSSFSLSPTMTSAIVETGRRQAASGSPINQPVTQQQDGTNMALLSAISELIETMRSLKLEASLRDSDILIAAKRAESNRGIQTGGSVFAGAR